MIDFCKFVCLHTFFIITPKRSTLTVSKDLWVHGIRTLDCRHSHLSDVQLVSKLHDALAPELDDLLSIITFMGTLKMNVPCWCALIQSVTVRQSTQP